MKPKTLLRGILAAIFIIVVIIVVVVVWHGPDPVPCPQCKLETVKDLGIAELVLTAAAFFVSNKVRNFDDKQFG